MWCGSILKGKGESAAMKKIPLTIASTILAGAMIFASACAVGEPEKEEFEPYEYTHTTELKQFELYEYSHIKDIDRTVIVTLSELGYPDFTLSGEEKSITPSVEYWLPEDATQGPDTWYIIHLHFLIEFDEATGGGFCSVSAKVNDRTGASVQFETLTVNDSPFIRISGEPATSTSTKIEVRYYNYMSSMSIKPGKNVMTFKLEVYQRTKVKSVTILNDTGLESTTVPPSDYEEGLKLTQEEQEKAKGLAFSDPRVQAIAEGKEYAIRITKANGIPRPSDEPPDDDIEVRLVFATTYMIEDVQAGALDIFVDLNERKVTYLFPLRPSGMPELTESVREKAVDIALSDADVQNLLEGKEYEITRIGPCQGGPVGRLGANMDITFDKAYPFKGDFPSFPEKTDYLDAQITRLEVFVNLKEGKVVQIFPMIVPQAPNGGEK